MEPTSTAMLTKIHRQKEPDVYHNSAHLKGPWQAQKIRRAATADGHAQLGLQRSEVTLVTRSDGGTGVLPAATN